MRKRGLGTPAPTMDDIARLAGVSKPTVSRALHDSPLVTDETKARIVELARKHGYVVNRNAQNLRRQRSHTIIAVLDFPSLPEQRMSDPFHFELLANITNALALRRQDLLLCSPQPGDSYRSLLAEKGGDGIIFVGQGSREALLRDLSRSNTPFVVWGAQLEGSRYCTVGSDNHRGGWLVGRRFASLKRRRILFLGPRGHEEIDLRRMGLADGAGRAIDELVVGDLSYRASLDAMAGYLGSHTPPDAVFAASDTMAIAAIAALRQAGLSVPGDVSVCGYDDSPMAPYHTPALTTVRQDTRLAGALLVESLMQMLEGSRAKSVVLPTELIVRET